ncbi:pyruvate dehydrogenase E1 component subunit alpha, mitochondrial [Drosophila novamexicana]|uniref:pyruvate dehydrogenase E1 component subunit alpha, mitochondrial n=1 Tax=Drosophila novamexicana TaxID=47314 RepID=UPI0011E60593|nr:pyruvate dehydrogenase E1 component subunit alpha, mitochondrial [Drosophila novamexicana]
MLSAAKRTAKGRQSYMQLQLLYNFCGGKCKARFIWRPQRHLSSGCSTLTLENTFKCYELDKGPPTDVELSREDALKMYKQMVEVRRIEVASGNLYKSKHVRGFCHLYIGQEAIAVGMCAVLRKNDSVITAYRAHGWSHLMGVPPLGVIGELVGVKGGCSRGKGGSMHMYSDNFFGGNGIVGAQVPLGAGIGLAHRFRGDGGVCVTCYGDGAANQGQVYEAFNMAKLWCLPCIFVCENNHYGMGTHMDRHAALTDFYMRGQYIPGLWVDGNQVLAVRSATQFAIDYVKKHGPIVLEMYTYRFEGHSMSDPGTSYRSRDEIKKVRSERDPIESFRKQIIALCLADEEELKKIDVAVRKEIDGVSKKVLADREVGMEELVADIYSKNMEPKIRGVSGYMLDHKRISEVCFGKPKRTPPEEINNVPVGDAALMAAQLDAKQKQDAKKSKGKPTKEGKPEGSGDVQKGAKPADDGKKDAENDNKPAAGEGVAKKSDKPPTATVPPAAAPPAAAPPAATPAAATPPKGAGDKPKSGDKPKEGDKQKGDDKSKA